MTKREKVIDRLERGDTILVWCNKAYVSGNAGKDLKIGDRLFWDLVHEHIISECLNRKSSMGEWRFIKKVEIENRTTLNQYEKPGFN